MIPARWIETLAFRAGIIRGLERLQGQRLVVITYHRVVPAADVEQQPMPNLCTALDVFERQLAFLAARFTVLPLREAWERFVRGGTERLAVLTFDDGYGDNHEFAAPALARHGLRATFFVTSGTVLSGDPLWWDRFSAASRLLGSRRVAEIAQEILGESWSPLPPGSELRPALLKSWSPEHREAVVDRLWQVAAPSADGFRPMRPAQVAELARGGHEIGGHSVSHPILPQLETARLDAELRGCRRDLETMIGETVTSFCYPNGDEDPRVAAAVQAAGFELACTTRAGLNRRNADPMRIRRFELPGGERARTRATEPRDLRAELSSFRPWIRRVRDVVMGQG